VQDSGLQSLKQWQTNGDSMTGTEVKKFAEMIVALLKFAVEHPEKEQIDSETPIKGSKIAERFNLRFGTDYDDSDVRQAVNFSRSTLKQPVCSSCKGYWFARNKSEWDSTTSGLKSRISEMQSAITGGDRYWLDPGMFPNE